MPQRTCLRCGSSWSSAVSRCVFCGGDSRLEEEAAIAGILPPRVPRPPVPGPAAELDFGGAPAAVAVAEEPEEAPTTAIPLEVPVEAATPVPAVPPPPVEEPARPACRRAVGTLVLGLAGLAASAAVVPSALGTWVGTLANVALLAGALAAPLAPMAWLLGLRDGARCRALGIPPGLEGLAGKYLGIVSTFALALGLAALAVLVALQRLMVL